MWVFHHFTDKYSRFGYVYRKFNALDKFFPFKAQSDNLLGIRTKSLQLDRGDMPSKFDSFHRSIILYPSYVH